MGFIKKLQYGARFAEEKLFEIFLYNKKTTSSLTPTLKKLIKFQKFIFLFVTIFEKKTHTLSYDRESLVTSLLVFFSQKQVIHFQITASAPVKMQKNVNLPFSWADSDHLKNVLPL